MTITPIIFGYVLVAIIVLWYWIKTEGYILTRIATIVIVVGYGVALMFLIPALKGWPIETKLLPDKAQVASYIIKEPRGADKGSIFFWIIQGRQDPRSYKMPYSREMHKKLAQTKKRMGPRGRLVVTNRKGKGKTKGKGGGDSNDSSSSFRVLNPRALPRK